MEVTNSETRYLYWANAEDIDSIRGRLDQDGYTFQKTLLTPCQVLKTRPGVLTYAPPKIWSGACGRQGSWYRSSTRNGSTMIMSDEKLVRACPGSVLFGKAKREIYYDIQPVRGTHVE